MDFFNLFTPDGVMLEPGVIYTVIALMFLYTFVGICAGFGGGLTTMPLITLMLPVKMATPLSVIVGTATAIYATWLSRKETDWRSAAVLIGFSFLGIPVGLYALSYLPDHIMKIGLGGFLILYSFYSMFIPRLPIYDRRWIAAPLGAIAGALGAAFSTNGPPVVMYGMLRNLGPAAFRGTLNAFFTANNIAVVGGLATSGILTISTFKLVIFCIPTMILGSLVGQYVHKRISVKVFRVLVFLLLIASGAMLIKGALGVSAATALLPPFVLLAILQILLGKKIAEIRKVDASK
ncbi:sulfite exporter TauE/SafE family protein [Salmonella enterica subsp. enterica serovar Heidelberg]|uniref:Probable membrane transporter protein n=61 Tax=Salmonella enterica TaxID=28901 RepID=A0A5W5RKL6_SALET|nr:MULTISPECIES: sulfite exporter TauE/SafE family protein [Salmonella]AZT39257.1 sulfite exporter TauE/SafE family protein [Salmonella enterica subsp. enterica serovar Karamoja]AZT78594.1 sulfite exporter TauE/SafE family protein [Salmonella enterica subsp. enterica serovar Bareilly]EAA0562157.1 sulfite exporter TauE/SafE family protein [Salmonella enterica subsp. enterica serovar Lexington]EAA0699816.1 sulfite exporter TauE/SafE family protein [Salmonella enterica subsp. enterica serovar Nott